MNARSSPPSARASGRGARLRTPGLPWALLLLLALAPQGRADKRFAADTPPEVRRTVLETERQAGRFWLCNGRSMVAREAGNGWLERAVANLGHPHELVAPLALDLIFEGIRDGRVIGTDVRAVVLPAVAPLADPATAAAGVAVRAKMVLWIAEYRIRDAEGRLAMLEGAFSGRGEESWRLTLEGIDLAVELGSEEAEGLLERRLAREKNRGSNLALRLRAAQAELRVARKAAGIADEWDRALFLHGAIVSSPSGSGATHLACNLIRALELQGTEASIAYLEDLRGDETMPADVREAAGAAVLRCSATEER